MRPLRLPIALARRLMDSPSGSVRRLRLRARPGCDPGRSRCRQADHRAWSFGPPVLLPAVFRTDANGISQVSWRPVPRLCPALRPRPNRSSWPSRTSRHRPRLCKNEGFGALCISWLNHTASAHAVYASRAPSPTPMQDSLPADGLRLYRRGFEPHGSLRKVSGHPILLSRPSPVATQFACQFIMQYSVLGIIERHLQLDMASLVPALRPRHYEILLHIALDNPRRNQAPDG